MIYYIPPVNLLGRGCLQEAEGLIKALGKRKTLMVSDKFLVKMERLKK
ncbi:MAG: hypothetical protein VB018_03120 [Lachnospiraceae bacterium]|nr:hypothetical protein [Lachnospiraceae bacterium]